MSTVEGGGSAKKKTGSPSLKGWDNLDKLPLESLKLKLKNIVFASNFGGLVFCKRNYIGFDCQVLSLLVYLPQSSPRQGQAVPVYYSSFSVTSASKNREWETDPRTLWEGFPLSGVTRPMKFLHVLMRFLGGCFGGKLAG